MKMPIVDIKNATVGSAKVKSAMYLSHSSVQVRWRQVRIFQKL